MPFLPWQPGLLSRSRLAKRCERLTRVPTIAGAIASPRCASCRTFRSSPVTGATIWLPGRRPGCTALRRRRHCSSGASRTSCLTRAFIVTGSTTGLMRSDLPCRTADTMCLRMAVRRCWTGLRLSWSPANASSIHRGALRAMTALHPEPRNNGPCNVAAALVEQACQQPQSPAIHYPLGVRKGTVDYRSATYAELDALSDCYARGLLQYGIERGARVALMVPSGLDFFALFFALFKAGIVPVLIDPGIGLKPLKTCLAEAEPEAFIGITRAQLARVILRWSPQSIRRSITLGPRLGGGGLSLSGLARRGGVGGPPVLVDTQAEEIAAILFTSGSTGIPKGVVYRHRHFTAQVDMLREAYGIQPGEVDLPTFPPFALFDPALGMTTVIPPMDFTRPAQVDPAMLVSLIDHYAVTNLFGSPALMNTLTRHLDAGQIKLHGLRRVLSAGAAVPADT